MDLKQLNTAVLKHRNEMITFARDLIRIPSFSMQEGRLVERIKKEMIKVGFDRIKIDAMGNIIGFIGKGKKKIMIDAHIDTVGIGDRTAWKIDPFGGVFKKRPNYGRGG